MRQNQEDTNIPHQEGLPALRKRLQSQTEKYVSTNTIIGLAKVVLKKTYLHSIEKFVPLSSILFMTELEKEVIKESEYKLNLWWRYTEDIFLLWEHGKNKLKSFNDKINTVHHFTNL